MNSHIKPLLKYARYFITASNGKGHGIHSPFVFHFIQQVLNDKTNYPEYKMVEDLRHSLLKDSRVIFVKDLGAGSAITNSARRSVASIVKNAAKPPRYAQLLFRMVRFFKPANIIELGTSLGITTSYLALANAAASIITLEGAPMVIELAKKNFERLSIKNIQVVDGNFDEKLPPLIELSTKMDFVFIDGNHLQQPTERYFSWLLKKATNDTVLVFDDIHWSDEMEAAWKTIQQHPAVTATIDLFFIGIVFFRKEFRQKEHFIIRF
ncbi:MAG TPA: class I SAM-dependent methyltransferase [Chitinophagaceae bacterium]